MNFGDKLKALRAERNWTQPDAAHAIGVEQSYLSKLENGHSTPSGEVFGRIAEAYETDVPGLLEGLDHSAKAQLRQIAEVDNHLSTQTEDRQAQERLWRLLLTVSVALGAALIYAGMTKLFFTDAMYWYKSLGVVPEGAPIEYFDMPPQYVRGMSHDEIEALQRDISNRLSEAFVTSLEYRGRVYNEPVTGGSRTYDIFEKREINAWKNQSVTFLGVFAVTFGILGLLVQGASHRRRG